MDRKFSQEELAELWARVEPLVEKLGSDSAIPDAVVAAQAIAQSNGDQIPVRDVARKLIILDARGDITSEECRALLAYV